MKISARIAAWQARLPLRASRVAWLVGGSFALVAFGHFAPARMDLGLGERLAFYVRAKLGRSPRLDPRLKILAFDDTMADEIKAPDLPPEAWARLLDGLTRARVKVTLIDKIFGLPFTPGPEFEQLRTALRRGAPSATGAFTMAAATLHRDILPVQRPEFAANHYAAAPDAFDWLPVTAATAYGPHSDLIRDVQLVGQIMIYEHGRIRPFLRLSNAIVVPHLSLFAADSVTVDRQGVTANGIRVPLDGRGAILPNLTDAARFYASGVSIVGAYRDVQHGRPISGIAPGDVVLLLPNLFTGSTDSKDTAVGDLPGGFIVAALANSVMTGKWLGYVEPGLSGLFAVCLVGAALALLLRTSLFIASYLAASVVLIGGALALFCYADTVVSWILPQLGLTTTAFVIFLERMRVAERETHHLRRALDGMVDPVRLDSLVANPQARAQTASERVVTLMFIDIVGFSAAAESQTPRLAFSLLRDAVRRMSEVVHRHEGIVDRTLGDGLLCYFGYRFGEDLGGANHADQALECAREIQRDSLALCVENGRTGAPVFPLRIGINTGGVYIGDLGDARRVDFTVIGHGVNIAQRLEAACESFNVMVGTTTLALSTKYVPTSTGFKRRLIAIKHQPEPVEVFECNPHLDHPELLMEGITAHRKFAGYHRDEDRYPVIDPAALRIRTDYGEARLVDYSSSGFAMLLPKYLARGLSIAVAIEPIGVVPAETVGGVVPSIVAEVRWGRALGDAFLHGVLVKNLAPEQRVALFQLFQNSVGRAAKPLDKAG